MHMYVHTYICMYYIYVYVCSCSSNLKKDLAILVKEGTITHLIKIYRHYIKMRFRSS